MDHPRGRARWSLMIPVAFDGEALHPLARGGDAFHHPARPAGLDADDDHRGDVRVAAGADEGAEVELQILPELKTPVVVGKRQHALDVVGHGLASGVRQIIEGQGDDVVADADPVVLAAVARG